MSSFILFISAVRCDFKRILRLFDICIYAQFLTLQGGIIQCLDSWFIRGPKDPAVC